MYHFKCSNIRSCKNTFIWPPKFSGSRNLKQSIWITISPSSPNLKSLTRRMHYNAGVARISTRQSFRRCGSRRSSRLRETRHGHGRRARSYGTSASSSAPPHTSTWCRETRARTALISENCVDRYRSTSAISPRGQTVLTAQWSLGAAGFTSRLPIGDISNSEHSQR